MSSVPSRPIYRTRGEIPQLTKIRRNGNFGLFFNKFPDHWGMKKDNQVDKIAFDPGKTESNKKSWLRKIAGNHPRDRKADSPSQAVGNSDAIQESAERLYCLIESRGGKVFAIENRSRFLTGAGLEHPTRNGMLLHPTLGVPFIPGSTVKGVLSAWNWQTLWADHVGEDGEYDDDRRRTHDAAYISEFGRLLGTTGQVGGIQFTDVLPVRTVELDVEILTPHYGKYYASNIEAADGTGQEATSNNPNASTIPSPGDWHSPLPVEYLVVAAKQVWVGGIIPSPRTNAPSLNEVLDLLRQAIEELGIGAKTEIGLGVFEFLENATDHRPDFLSKAANSASARPMVENLQQPYDDSDLQVKAIIGDGGDDPNSRPQAILRFYDLLSESGDTLSIDAARWICSQYLGDAVIKALPQGAETAAKKKKKLKQKKDLLEKFLPVIEAIIETASRE